MNKLSRRTVVISAAAAAILPPRWFADIAKAAPVTPYTRFNVESPEGQKMLEKYAKAVGLMSDRGKFPLGDARSWTFQFYTHWLPPGPTSNYPLSSSQKEKIVKTLPANERPLAEAMWNDCQSHSFNPADQQQFQETYFCVWHRWYVYYLEHIIRGVLEDDDFSLPYWNYTSGHVKDLSIPAAFRERHSPLYRPNRNAWVNAGERIDKQNPGPINVAAIGEPRYIDQPDGSIGFCPQLDGNPHGLVHVYVGNSKGMGNVPYAADDPIFWLHHCNIDRIWESWNRGTGHSNPAWSRKFVFADAKGDWVDVEANGATRVSELKYQYDSYIPVPANAPAIAFSEMDLRSAAASPPVIAAKTQEPVVLGAKAVNVPLAPQPAPNQPTAPADMQTRAQSLAPGRQIYLVARDITSNLDPSVTYNIYLDAPEGATPTGAEDPHYVGTVHFFGAGPENHTAHSHSLSFNVTDKLKELGGANKPGQNSITLVPVGDVDAQSARIGSVELVER
jgi:tyrosinase